MLQRLSAAILWLGLSTTACVGLAPATSLAASFPSTYDRQIKAAAEVYLPTIPWKLGKAQLWQESHLKADAVSPAGAQGIAQFMPATWREVTLALKLGVVDRTQVEPSLLAWAYYMARVRERWKSTPEWDRHKLALGGYNAGNGNIGRASKACDNSRVWDIVAKCLPEITGRFSRETIDYVRNTFRWWAMMEA